MFSHETALALHDLSDALPGKVHLTVPTSWRRRRLRVPAGLVLHFADVGDVDTLKGGLVLELRLARARTTKGIDLRLVGSSDDVLELL